MSYLIDRRENAKHKNMVNRRRFMNRYKKHIKKAVEEAVDARSIKDMERGEDVAAYMDFMKVTFNLLLEWWRAL